MSLPFLGQIRPSQIVTTFGPGSIVDLRADSVMMLGLDFWPSIPSSYRTIQEPRLEAILRVREFHVPVSVNNAGNVPSTTFPKFRTCADCNSLAPAYRDMSKQTFVCVRCKRPKTYPARLIMACPKGHIDDFPWSVWVHRGKTCAKLDLSLISTRRTAAIADLIVHCNSCNSNRSLAGALRELDVPCNGKRPWLQDEESSCEETPRGLQRGASNVYFSVIESSLSIPPWTNPLQRELDLHWTTISSLLDRDQKVVDAIIPTLFPDYTTGEVWAAIRRRQGVRAGGDLRAEEWLALRSKVPIEEIDFEIMPEPVPEDLAPWIESLARITRLREVRAIKGFTRIDPPDPESRATRHSVPISKSHYNWLPGVEVYGEGVFFALNKGQLETWEASSAVTDRTSRLYDVYKKWRKSLGWAVAGILRARNILLHTLAHIAIRQLALDSGYSSASIRERIYASESMYGVLLYTSSDDSEGSLGGLVQHGKTSAFQSLIEGALRSAVQCSSDPLCLENDPSITKTLNGSACHVCAFVSETSCEVSNRLLDRRLVLPSQTLVESYFKDLKIEP